MDTLRCALCGEIIGVYEPARAILSDGADRHGSRLTLRSEFEAPATVAIHERCAHGVQTTPPSN